MDPSQRGRNLNLSASSAHSGGKREKESLETVLNSFESRVLEIKSDIVLA